MLMLESKVVSINMVVLIVFELLEHILVSLDLNNKNLFILGIWVGFLK